MIRIVSFIVVFFIINLYDCFSEKIYYGNGDFSFCIELGAGVNTMANLKNVRLDDLSFSPFARLLWKPNRLLNIGIESSLFDIIRKENIKKGTIEDSSFFAEVRAIPILLVFNIEIGYFDIYAGMGAAKLFSKLTAFDKETFAGRFVGCYTLGIGYSHVLFKNFGIGAEFKMHSLSDINRYGFFAGFKLVYDFYSY